MATIEFPVSGLDDKVREHLGEKYEIRFNDGLPVDHYGDITVEVADGALVIYHEDAGSFEDLRGMLKEKGVPFDYGYTMDCTKLQVYRPAHEAKSKGLSVPEMNLHLLLDPETDDPVVSVAAIREFITINVDTGLSATERMIHLKAYLNKQFPVYPPLADFVKEV